MGRHVLELGWPWKTAELKADSLQRALESPFQASLFQRAPEQPPLNLSVTEVPRWDQQFL